MVWSPLAGGLLSGKYGREQQAEAGSRRVAFDFPPVDKERAWDAIDAMRPIAQARGTSVAQVALAWLLHQPQVTSVIVGAKRPEQLADNIGATGLTLGADELARIDEASRLPPSIPAGCSSARASTGAGSWTKRAAEPRRQARGLPPAVPTSGAAMDRQSRRIFLKVSGAAALTPAGLHAAAPAAPAHGHDAARSAAPGAQRAGSYLFFSAVEAAFVEPAVDRLIPPDALGPGAREAGVPEFMDLQLAGAWGAGERLYRSGPWAAGTPSQGYQLPFTPAELFRNALRGVAMDLQRAGKDFAGMAGPEQDAYLTGLQNGVQDLEGVPARVFFESLLAMTVEGYFCDPAYGGNKGMAAWAMIGFPGAYGNYYEVVDRHGVAFNVPPRSLAQDAAGHVQPLPVARPAAGPGQRKGSR
ncbi:MAG: hypothetical protein JWQ13_1285 [Ramlibacter sp.]|nr:hypothetical protein [Ramlibacter sp.]